MKFPRDKNAVRKAKCRGYHPYSPEDKVSLLKLASAAALSLRKRLRRFCLNNNIVRNRITTDELEGHVRTAVDSSSVVIRLRTILLFKQDLLTVRSLNPFHQDTSVSICY